MQEKITRKELRQDDKFHLFLVNLANKVRIYKKRLYLISGIIVVIVVFSLVWSAQRNKREGMGQAALSKVYQDTQAERSALEAQVAKNKERKIVESKVLTKEVVDNNEIKRLETVANNFKGTKAALQGELRVAQLYFNMGNFKEALNRYKNIADSTTNELFSTIVYYGLAYAEEELGNYEAASSAFDTVSKKSIPFYDSSALMGEARVLSLLKKNEEARKTYEEIIKRWPNSEISKRSEQYISLLNSMANTSTNSKDK